MVILCEKKIKQKHRIIFYRLKLPFRVNQAWKLNVKYHTWIWITFWLDTCKRQVLHSWKSTLNIFGRGLFRLRRILNSILLGMFKWKNVLFYIFNSHYMQDFTHRNCFNFNDLAMKYAWRIIEELKIKFWGYVRQTLIFYYLWDIYLTNIDYYKYINMNKKT